MNQALKWCIKKLNLEQLFPLRFQSQRVSDHLNGTKAFILCSNDSVETTNVWKVYSKWLFFGFGSRLIAQAIQQCVPSKLVHFNYNNTFCVANKLNKLSCQVYRHRNKSGKNLWIQNANKSKTFRCKWSWTSSDAGTALASKAKAEGLLLLFYLNDRIVWTYVYFVITAPYCASFTLGREKNDTHIAQSFHVLVGRRASNLQLYWLLSCPNENRKRSYSN